MKLKKQTEIEANYLFIKSRKERIKLLKMLKRILGLFCFDSFVSVRI
jgi:hypothetical protein